MSTPLPHGDQHIALIGLGAIGISFLALHLTYTSATISVYDPRPDLQDHVATILPLYLPRKSDSEGDNNGIPATASAAIDADISSLVTSRRLRFCTSLAVAVSRATIIQEQGPEKLAFKQATWSEVLRHAGPTAHLWSSTSGIPASEQLSHLSSTSKSTSTSGTGTGNALGLSEATILSARSRLLVVHPFNPPHLMPLLELVPSPHTAPEALAFADAYFRAVSPIHRPITLRRETAGFVANRLSFVLFREACSLVARGVCTVEELDEVVRASLGPRWAVGGPFRMYNFGGGQRGMAGFLDNIGGAISGVWDDVDRQVGSVTMDDGSNTGKTGKTDQRVRGEVAGGDEAEEEERNRVRNWKDVVTTQTMRAYGVPGPQDVRTRDRALGEVVGLQVRLEKEEKANK
jgi:3-hydroxyacyl-CoA dehydrogenase